MAKFEHSVSDRMQVIGRGDLLFPGTCMHCGNGTCDDGYVKLDVHYDYEGEQYLCLNCVKQMIDMVGGCWPEDFADFMTEKLEIEVKLNETSEHLRIANERLAVYDAAILAARPDNANSGDIVSLEDEPEVPESDEQLELPINSGESESEEPVKVGGPDDPNGDAASNTRTKRTFNL